MPIEISANMSTTIIAICDILEGTESFPGVGSIDFRRLFENVTPTTVFHADVSDNCLYVTEIQAEKEWARYIVVAKNCHEQNLEITNTPRGLIVRAIKNIKVGDELLVWFGMDLLSKLEFPFLNPLNIKGNQAYHCHRCGSVYKDPNPLKVHLSFVCRSTKIPPTEFSLTESKSWNCNTAELFPRVVMKLNESEQKVPPISRNDSIFRDQEKHFFTNNHTLSSRSFHDDAITVHDTTANQVVLQQSVGNLASPIPSNWKSNIHVSQGHICAFCGKIYSRKYGLKIHVRTHTGYKPLKCKYCFRPFSDPSNLNKHVRLHSESDAPYRCLKCGKVLVRKRDLDRHIKSRHPQMTNEKSNSNI